MGKQERTGKYSENGAMPAHKSILGEMALPADIHLGDGEIKQCKGVPATPERKQTILKS